MFNSIRSSVYCLATLLLPLLASPCAAQIGGVIPALNDVATSLNDVNETCFWRLEAVTLLPATTKTYDIYDGATLIGTATTSIANSPDANGNYPVTATATLTATGYTLTSVTLPPTNASQYGLTPTGFPTSARVGTFHAPTRILGASGMITVNWKKPVGYPGYYFGYTATGSSSVSFLHTMNWRNEVWHCYATQPNNPPTP